MFKINPVDVFVSIVIAIPFKVKKKKKRKKKKWVVERVGGNEKEKKERVRYLRILDKKKKILENIFSILKNQDTRI